MRKVLETTMQRLGYPAEAMDVILQLYDRMKSDPARMHRLEGLMVHFWEKEDDVDKILDSLRDLSVCTGECVYTVHHLFFLMLTPALLEKYREADIAEWVYWDTLQDFRAKLHECRKNHGVWGSEPTAWFNMFFRLTRFGLGRLQFEPRGFLYDDFTVHGITFHKDDPVVNIHIPSLGPLTKELRIDAYRKAYEFFKDRFGGVVPIACGSWLMYPRHAEYLPADSNIVDFAKDFKTVHVDAAAPGLANFSNSWRVFNKPQGTPAEELPRDTRMQRAMLDWFAKGGDSGSAYGMLIVDENGIYID